MKIFSIKIALVLIASVFLLDSCTLTKRRYNKGVHIDWFSGGKKDTKSETSKDHQSVSRLLAKTDTTQILDSKKEDQLPLHTSRSIWSQKTESAKPNSDKNLHIVKNTLPDFTNENRNKHQSAEKIAKRTQRLAKKVIAKTNDAGSNRPIGVALLILGIVVALFVSLLLGVVLLLIGIVIMGRNPKSRTISNPPASTKPEEKTYIDVVYLKNGSIIKGQIIEQIPSVSLKIETTGGSIFVYKMDEVEKITKEVKSN
jgi:hypothetical protein